MKMVLIVIGVLLLGSGAYLSSVQTSTAPQPNKVVDSLSAPLVVADKMCTSTACMKKPSQTAVTPPKDKHTFIWVGQKAIRYYTLLGLYS